jgi:hypothetical protein
MFLRIFGKEGIFYIGVYDKFPHLFQQSVLFIHG